MRKHASLFVIVTLFTLCSWKLISSYTRFHGIEHWPHVSATIISAQSSSVETRTDTKYSGTQSTYIDTGTVEFSYEVDGVAYTSHLVTPEGGSLPAQPSSTGWKAYYNPSNPGVAVLEPKPYEGFIWIIITAFLGIALSIYVFVSFFVPDNTEITSAEQDAAPNRLHG